MGRGGGGGHGGGGHGGGGHGSGGGGRGYGGYGGYGGYNQTTQWVVDGSYDTPVVPALTYHDHVSGNFMTCLSQKIAVCNASFNGEGFRACLHGVLSSSDLLAQGVQGGVMDVQGGFSRGLSLGPCPRETADVVPQIS
jgi:hypothetical protein